MQLHTSTLLVVLVASNALMAAALWVAGALRAGLGQWAGALIAQGFAWLVLLAPYHASNPASLVIAGALLAYGGSLQISAVFAFHERPTPFWLPYGPPLASFFGLSVWAPLGDSLPLFDSIAAPGAWLLAIYVLTVCASFAFVLAHQKRVRELATDAALLAPRLRNITPHGRWRRLTAR